MVNTTIIIHLPPVTPPLGEKDFVCFKKRGIVRCTWAPVFKVKLHFPL